MRALTVVVASLCLVGTAMAQTAPGPADTAGAACQSQIGPKNLHGAALKSSATKCCKDAAKTAKLHGAAATSFVKKCVSDVVPPAAPKT